MWSSMRTSASIGTIRRPASSASTATATPSSVIRSLDSVWAYGPEKLVSAFECIHFRVLENGEAWVKMAFCANMPQRILIQESSLSRLLLNAADRVTAGMASRLGEPLIRAYDSSPFSYVQPDPSFLFIDLANLATLGLAGSETRPNTIARVLA